MKTMPYKTKRSLNHFKWASYFSLQTPYFYFTINLIDKYLRNLFVKTQFFFFLHFNNLLIRMIESEIIFDVLNVIEEVFLGTVKTSGLRKYLKLDN